MSRRPNQAGNTDTWRIRRRWMSALLVWMVANSQYLIFFGQDNALHQNALITLLGAIVAVIGSYVFGAVWDDRGKNSIPTNSGEGE